MSTELKDLCDNWEVIYYGWVNGEYFICINYPCFKSKFKPIFTIKFENQQYATEFRLKRCYPHSNINLKGNVLELTCDEWYTPLFLSCRKDLDLAINLTKMLRKQLYSQIEQQIQEENNIIQFESDNTGIKF